MNWRVKGLNQHLKRHDESLYASMDNSGKVHLYRRSGDKKTDYVFSLTDDWTTKGTPRDWGVDPILNRLRAHDLAHNPDFFRQLEKHQEQYDESKKRDFRNSVESFLTDFRRQFARAFNDVNTSGLAKEPGRKQDELKEKSNGYR